MQFDGTDTLNIDAVTANDTVRVGETISTDVQFDGASSDLLWDASANSLTNGGFLGLFAPDAAVETITNTDGAVSITTSLTQVSGASDGNVLVSLADATTVGQVKTITLTATGTDDVVITPASYADGTTMTLGAVGDFCVLVWNGTNWRTIAHGGGTIA